jgi:hypothetical protein
MFSDRLVVCGKGTDSTYYLLILAAADGTVITDWTGDFGGAGTFTSKPAVVQSLSSDNSEKVLNVFGLGTDGAVWRNAFAFGEWSGWQQVPGLPGGGPATSAPSVHTGPFSDTAIIQLCIRGANGYIFRNLFDGWNWGGWIPTDLSLSPSDPAMAVKFDGVVLCSQNGDERDIEFALGQGNVRDTDQNWRDFPFPATSDFGPAVAVDSHGESHVFSTALDSIHIHHQLLAGPVEQIGGLETFDAPAATYNLQTNWLIGVRNGLE